MRSVTSRSDGRGGKMYVPRAMYSFRMSFCVVPPMRASATPCFFATATYIARRIAAVALIVIEVVTLSSGIPANSCPRSSRHEIETPTFPTSPATCGSSAS
jgi:hypothetical protein